MLRLLLIGLAFLVTLCVAQKVLPPGDYVLVGPAQVIIGYKNDSLSVSVVEQQLAVNDNGIQAIWSTRMQYFSPNFGTVQALVTLSLVASIAPSGNLLLAVDACLQNDLETQFTAAMCPFFLTSAGCVGNEFIYSQADLGEYVNQTAIAIQNMCGVNAVLVFSCLGEDVCAGPLPGFGPALPSGAFALYGPTPNFNFPANVNPILNAYDVVVADNNCEITIDIGLYVIEPTPLQGNVSISGFAFEAPSGQTLFSFVDCTEYGITGLCTSLIGACSAPYTVSQVNLDPGNDTYNDTLLIFGKTFCGLQGAIQSLCFDGECELPLSSGSSGSLGFTAGNCLDFDGTVLDVVGGCTVSIFNIGNSTVENQVVSNQHVVYQLVDDSVVTNQNVTLQRVEQQIVASSNVTDQTVTTQYFTTQYGDTQTVNTQFVSDSIVGIETISESANQFFGDYLGGLFPFWSAPQNFVMGFKLVADYSGSTPILCGDTGLDVYNVWVQRVANFVTGWMTLTSNIAHAGFSGCAYYGSVSGALGVDFIPALAGGGGITQLIQDANGGGCFCELSMTVMGSGVVYFNALKSVDSDSCCTGGSSQGFANAGDFSVLNSEPISGGTASFWYMMPPF